MSTSLALLLASQGGGAGVIRQFEVARTSRTITAAHDGVADILLIGGSPSGGAAFGGFVAGGGAPGTSVKRIKVSAGESFVVTVGAAGPAVTRSSAGATPGNAGGNSTLTGPGGLSMAANGGQPGEAKTTKPVLGGAGGTASGGDINSQGGRGGDVLATAAANAAAGSGAVNMRHLPAADIRGGTINTTGNQAVSGGAGVGGRGADITGSAGILWATGGGYGGPATDNLGTVDARGANAMGAKQAASPTELVVALAGLWGIDHFGGGGSGTNAPGPGGGSGSAAGTNTAVAPGIFAGAAGMGLVTGPAAKGNVGPGGSIAHTAACTSGEGDAGLCIFIIRG